MLVVGQFMVVAAWVADGVCIALGDISRHEGGFSHGRDEGFIGLTMIVIGKAQLWSRRSNLSVLKMSF